MASYSRRPTEWEGRKAGLQFFLRNPSPAGPGNPTARLWAATLPRRGGVGGRRGAPLHHADRRTTQFTTVTTTFPVVLPTVLALESLLILLSPSKHDRSSPGSRHAAVLCAAAASAHQRVRGGHDTRGVLPPGHPPAPPLGPAASRGRSGRFRALPFGRRSGFRPRTDVDIQLDRLVSDPWHVALRLANAAWSALFSACATVRRPRRSRSVARSRNWPCWRLEWRLAALQGGSSLHGRASSGWRTDRTGDSAWQY